MTPPARPGWRARVLAAVLGYAIALATAGRASLAVPQHRSLTVAEVRTIFGSGGDVAGWDEFDVPEFLAGAYGSRATAALIALLQKPSTVENHYFQLEALTAAQYGRTGVPTPLVMEYAAGQRGGAVGGVLRHRATVVRWNRHARRGAADAASGPPRALERGRRVRERIP